jgi:hypothetical protein
MSSEANHVLEDLMAENLGLEAGEILSILLTGVPRNHLLELCENFRAKGGGLHRPPHQHDVTPRKRARRSKYDFHARLREMTPHVYELDQLKVGLNTLIVAAHQFAKRHNVDYGYERIYVDFHSLSVRAVKLWFTRRPENVRTAITATERS